MGEVISEWMYADFFSSEIAHQKGEIPHTLIKNEGK